MTRDPKRSPLLDADERMLVRGLESALGPGIDEAELFLEHSVRETLTLERSQVRGASRDVVQGVGVRALGGERTGYAHSDEVTVQSLQIAGGTARAIARGGQSAPPVELPSPVRPAHDLYPVPSPPPDEPVSARIELLREIDRHARSLDPRVDHVQATLFCEQRDVAIVGSDGRNVSDSRPLVRLSVEVGVQSGATRRMATQGMGGRTSLAPLLEGDAWKTVVQEAVRIAVTNLEAVPCPAGEMDVVLGPGWPGILLHEAIGHGLEGDFNRVGTSTFSGRIGQRVASELCTVVDDGTLAARRGSLNIDDEGTATQRTVLIERGILVGYMNDRLNARLMGMPATGNGRRETYAHPPMPRMTNTFMLAGDDAPEDLIRGVDSGIYAVMFRGGSVDITSGQFVFEASEAYRIEKGKIGAPLVGATLIGNGPDVLTRIDGVGHDLELDRGIGVCGKRGQLIPVGVGLPTIRIRGLTVGGSAA
ncbi:MAG: metalloprotease TldD [Myxococcota bacterium]